MGRMYAKRLSAGGIKTYVPVSLDLGDGRNQAKTKHPSSGSTSVIYLKNMNHSKPNSKVSYIRTEADQFITKSHAKYPLMLYPWSVGTGITPLKDGHAVSRISDFIIYSVEAAYISSVVEQYGPSTKFGATVAGQTSVKAPEKEAFEKWLPDDVGIVSVHSLHGPSVTTEGQPLVGIFFLHLVTQRFHVTMISRISCSLHHSWWVSLQLTPLIRIDHHPSSWAGREC